MNKHLFPLFGVLLATTFVVCIDSPLPPIDVVDPDKPQRCLADWDRYTADTVAVRQILDSNRHFAVAVESITDVDSCGRISYLDLSRMNITTLPATICSLTELTQLNIYNNALTSLPNQLAQLRRLRVLKVQNNQLRQIPQSLAELDSLETLYLHDNNLTRLPDMFTSMKLLRTLELSKNNLDSLPPSLIKLSKVDISISGNRLCNPDSATRQWLEDVVVDVGNWRSTQECGWWSIDTSTLGALVRELDLDPTEFGPRARVNDGRIIGLDLSQQNIDNLPDTLFALIGLEYLNLSDNNLLELPIRFRGLAGLVNLDLSKNQIDTVPALFSSMAYLRQLDLSGNNLSGPETALFACSLQVLNISNNRIATLPPYSDSLNIDTLYVGGNLLCPDSLSAAWVEWLDTFAADDPAWSEQQTGCEPDTAQ